MLIESASFLRQVKALQVALEVITTLNIAPFHDFPPQASVTDKVCYDFVVVGAGTAGSVLASRLAEHQQTSVLLIEAGSDPQLESLFPSLMLYMKDTGSNWNFTTVSDDTSQLSVRPLEDEMGLSKQLGGTSSLSYTVYSPGNKYDYNNWAKRVNDSVWSWKNVLPYIKKTQRLLDDSIKNSPSGKFFGYKGKIGLTGKPRQLTVNLFKAVIEAGYDKIPFMDGNTTLGYSNGLFTVAGGLRQSTAVSYLAPAKTYPKFHVLKLAEVTRVIFGCNKTAIGVEVRTRDNRSIVIKARKEVILSAGVVNSPKLLMLSGIGPKDHLSSKKIKTISDLPVGKNLQDRLSIIVIYNFTNRVVERIPWSPLNFPADCLIGYASLNKSQKSHPKNPKPDYQTLLFVNYPLYAMRYCVITYGFKDCVCNNMLETTVNSETVFIQINKQKFKSRGEVLLKSGDFREKPIIKLNYYDKTEDLEDNARIVEDFVKIENTQYFKKIGGVFQDPKLKACSGMKMKSRKYWKCYCQHMSSPQHHYTGTCAMGSVVDSKLKVYGVPNLRVVDASVMPSPTTGGTLGSSMMIGELASDLIKKDHGLLK